MTYLIDNLRGSIRGLGIAILVVFWGIAIAVLPTKASPATAPQPPIMESSVVVEKKVIPEQETLKITPHDERQLQCLAENAYFEAGNQSMKGMIAVTNVVMNRVEDNRFPKTPCAVIKQRYRGTCQFSWVCEGKKRIRNAEVFSRARAAAERVYLEQTHDVTKGALFYHAYYVNPRWNLKRVTTIGAHIFYKG